MGITYKVEENGKVFEYETGRNYTISKQIVGNHVGFSLGHSTNGYVSEILFKSNNFFDNKQPKNIGSLIYDPATDIVTYYKHIQQAKHEFHKSESLGINNLILSNMCPKDKIVIVEHVENKKYIHSISVRKAILCASYMTFKNYEKQAFIPKSEFKTTESEVKKKRGRKNAKSDK